jgi:hypothetical protein
MIRLLFAMFVTVAGFAAAALWMARGGDAREVAEEIFPAEVRSAVEQFDLEDVASQLPGSVPKEDAPDDPDTAADTAEPEKAVIAEEAVEERDLSPRTEFARDLGAAADDGSGDEDDEEAATSVTASARIWSDGGAPLREPDQDEWASLIRRMLAVYQRTGEVE